MEATLTGTPVPIADRVLALWTIDPLGKTRSFLASLDPGHFLIVADAVATLDGKALEHTAATHIRMLRDQAAEMLFALIAAAIQSPAGVILWLDQYRNDELDTVIGGFCDRKPVRTTTGTRALGWDDVAAEVTQHFAATEARDKYRDLHARFWRRLAKEFLDPIARKEFACLKHGLRVSQGGCEIAITPEITPGVRNPEAPSSVVHGSGFGSGFYVAERIESHRLHYHLTHHHRHWTPSSLLLQLDLIVNSIRNLILHLGVVNGRVGPVHWGYPTDDSVFQECWRNDGNGLLSSSMSEWVFDAKVPLASKEELIALCEASVDPNGQSAAP